MKRVLINVEDRELRVAILEDEQLLELYIESLEDKSILNNIYKGRIEGILPGLKAAFVNIGLERNAFLHFDDVRPDMLWARHRQDHPEAEVPAIAAPTEDDTGEATAAELAQAEEIEAASLEQAAEERADQEEERAAEGEEGAEAEGDVDADGRRRRRRGRRGGKRRKRDADQPFDPVRDEVLDADIDTADDDEDEEDDRHEGPVERVAQAQYAETAPRNRDDDDDDEEDTDSGAEIAAEGGAPASGQSRQEQQRNARSERQKRRRERWEQKKLERKLRRQQEGGGGGLPPYAGPQGQGQGQRPQQGQRQPVRPIQPHPTTTAAANAWVPPAMRGAPGTRGAANPYDVFSPYNQPQPAKRQWGRQRGGMSDDWGNQRAGAPRRNDHRDSQEDFFGPAPRARQPQYIDDDTQPFGPNDNRVAGANYYDDDDYGDGPAPGNEKFPTAQTGQNRNQQGGQRRQQQGGKRRSGGRNRSMKKRNPSYYAARVKKTGKAEAEVTPDLLDEVKPKVTRKKAVKAEPVAETPAAETKRPTRARKPKAEEAPAVAPEVAATEAPAPAKKRATRKKAEEPAAAVAVDVAAQQAAEPKAKPAAETKAAPTRKRTVKAKEAPAAEAPATASEVVAAPVPAVAETAAPSEAPAKRPSRRRGRQKEEAQPQPEAQVETTTSAGEVAQSVEKAAPSTETQPVAEGAGTGTPREERDRSRRRGRRGRGRDRDRDRGERQDQQATAAPVVDGAEVPAEEVREGEIVAQAPATAPATQGRPPRQTREERRRERDRERGRDRDKPRDKAREQKPRRWQRPPLFTETFKKGDEILVQVIKEEIGMKGARISTYVSMPGRYLVLLPYPNEEGGISRKVEDITERKRLKNLLKDISSDEMAFIIRTAGIYRDEADIRGDVEFLTEEWKQIAERAKTTEVGKVVYDDHDILYRLARDVFDDNVGEILIDSHVEADKLRGVMKKLIPSLVDKVKVYSGPENIFHKFGVEKQIQKAARRKVWLKSGGYLIIDEAEALTAIDVNTGKSVGKDDQEKLILKTNLEAARAVARELKLRDIGGLIVIDFIDMKDSRNRDQVVAELKTALRKDRSKTSVSTISEFGLVEMTRKRVRRSLRKTLFMDCPYCQGAGVVLNEQQIWLHLKHEIIRFLEATKPAPNLNITVNSKIRAYIDQNYRDIIRKLEQKYDAEIRFTMSDVFHIENYAIEKSGTSNAPAAMSAASGGR